VRLDLYHTTGETDGSESNVRGRYGTMIKRIKVLSFLLGIGLALMLPLKSHAGPIFETQAGNPIVVDFVFGPLAEVTIRIFDQGVNDPDPGTGDTRFSLLPSAPAENEYTYFYNISNVGFFDLRLLIIPLPVPEPGYDTVVSAGIRDADQNVTTITATGPPHPAINLSDDPPSIAFDLGPLGPSSALDLFIVSPFSPYDASGEIKIVGATLVGPGALGNGFLYTGEKCVC